MFPIEKFFLIREPDQDGEQWIKYLKSYDIDVIPNGKLMLIRLDCQKHILLTDLNLMLKYGRFNYRWQQSYESEISKKVLHFRQQIKLWNINYNFDQMPLDNFILFFDQNDVNLISLFPRKLKYQQNPSQIENLTTQFNLYSQKILKDQKQPLPKQNLNFKDFIKGALKFLTELRIDEGYQNDDKISFALKRIYSGYYEDFIEQILNRIQYLDDETKSEYLEKHIIEQSYDALETQVKYLQNLSQQGQINNQMRVSLIEQGNIACQVAHLEQTIQRTVQSSSVMFSTHKYQKLQDVTVANIRQSYMEKLQYCDLKYQISDLSEKKMAECVNIFIQELFKQYWFLDGISEIEQFNQVPNDLKEIIIKLLQNYEEKIRQIQNNNDSLKFFINQLVYSLKIIDIYEVLEKFLFLIFNQIKEAMKLIILDKKFFFDQKIIAEVFAQTNLDYNIRDKLKLKENIEIQNDILFKILDQLKTMIQISLEKHKQLVFPEKVEQIFEDILSSIFKGKLQIQLQILHEDFQNQLYQYYKKHEDYQLLKESIKPQDFKQLANLFCKSDTITLTTNYQNVAYRLKTSMHQYFNFSVQLKYLLSQSEEKQLQVKLLRDTLTQHFREYVISGKVLFLDLQFQSQKILNQFQKEIIEELKNRIFQQIEQRDKFISEMRESLKELYIPFKNVETHLSKCLDSEKNKQSVEIYTQISKVLRGTEESEIQQITQFKSIKQEKLQQWEKIKLDTLNTLHDTEPSQWNEKQLTEVLQTARSQYFQEEREKAQLCKILTGFACEKLKSDNNKFDTALSDPIKLPEDLLDQLYKCVDQQIKLQQTQQK